MKEPKKIFLTYGPWIVLLIFLGLSLLVAAMHPMHTDMSVVEHRLRCYGAALAGPFGIWLLPCCGWCRKFSYEYVFPVLFFVVTLALFSWKRICPFWILFAASLCFWLLNGCATLMVWK